MNYAFLFGCFVLVASAPYTLAFGRANRAPLTWADRAKAVAKVLLVGLFAGVVRDAGRVEQWAQGTVVAVVCLAALWMGEDRGNAKRKERELYRWAVKHPELAGDILRCP
jgi:hypothetical protein